MLKRFFVGLLVLVGVTFGAGASAEAAPWRYKYFPVKNNWCEELKLDREMTKVMTNVSTYITNNGPRADGVRLIPATNGFHLWVRRDRAGYRWRVARSASVSGSGMRSQIQSNAAVFAGFFRLYAKTAGGVCSKNVDEEFTIRLIRDGGRAQKMGNWAYDRIDTKTSGWKNMLTNFIKTQKPNNASYIQGGLSRGKVFHVWVRKGTSSCKWNVTNKAMPAASASLLGGTIKTAIAGRRFAPLGFNYQSPQHLWNVNLGSLPKCLKN